MAIGNIQAGIPAPITSATTTQVKTGDGVLLGVLFCSGTSPSVAIYDDVTTTGTAKVGTMVGTVGQYVPIPMGFSAGLRVVTAGTNPIVTVFYL